MIRGLAWAVAWRLRAIGRAYRDATWTERAALTAYAGREVAAAARSRTGVPAGETWIRLRGFDIRLALGRYELGGFMDVWLQHDYEQAADFRSAPGWVVVDVGANVGFFTLRQVAGGARVVALEPNPEVRARLAATIARNRLGDRVRLLPFAAGRSTGTAELSVGPATVTGTVAAGGMAGVRDRFAVEVRSLDAALADVPHVDLLKIDTEGAEVEVLAGAAATLARTERVVLEWHTPALRAAAGRVLEAAGLELVGAHGSIDRYRRADHEANDSARA